MSDSREIAADAIAAAERARHSAELRERIAQQAGLPAAFADRLKGEDAGALLDDARALAMTMKRLRGEDPTPGEHALAGVQAAQAAGDQLTREAGQRLGEVDPERVPKWSER